MIAIIKTGGKQYLVEPGKKIKIEKIKGEEGKETVFRSIAFGYSRQRCQSRTL